MKKIPRTVLVLVATLSAVCSPGAWGESDGGSGLPVPDGSNVPDGSKVPDSSTVQPDVSVWAASSGVLYRFDPDTFQVTEIGSFAQADGRPVSGMLDIAVNAAGAVYGVAGSRLWLIDTATAEVTEVALLGADASGNALSFVPAGVTTQAPLI